MDKLSALNPAGLPEPPVGEWEVGAIVGQRDDAMGIDHRVRWGESVDRVVILGSRHGRVRCHCTVRVHVGHVQGHSVGIASRRTAWTSSRGMGGRRRLLINSTTTLAVTIVCDGQRPVWVLTRGSCLPVSRTVCGCGGCAPR